MAKKKMLFIYNPKAGKGPVSYTHLIVQMDSVIGKPGGKCLLTVHFVETSFMLAFLRESNTAGSVIHIFQALDRILGAKDFNRLFPVILTDNGSEFSNPKEIEYRDTDVYKRQDKAFEGSLEEAKKAVVLSAKYLRNYVI